MLSRRRSRIFIAIVVAIMVIAAVFVASRLPFAPASGGNNPGTTNPTPSACQRSVGLCIDRNVTRVIDGDSLDIEGGLGIRRELVDAPERHATRRPEARASRTSVRPGSLP